MVTGVLLTVALAASSAGSQAPPKAIRDVVDKGLKRLASGQTKDGFWTTNGQFFRTNTTAHAGIALLMEGSTLRDGPYAENIRRAVGWFEKVADPSGALVPTNDPNEFGRVMHGHAAALLFLACAYDVDDDAPRRERLRKLITAGVRYAAEGQSSRGGWGFVRARDGADYDETTVTTAMLHALLTAERAGIEVPRASIRKALKNLADGTNRDGGLVFSLANGPPRGGDGQTLPTAAAAAALVGSEYRTPQFPQWVAFSKRLIRVPAVPKSPATLQTDSYTLMHHLPLARLANALGDEGHRRIDPAVADADHLRWSAYREQLFGYLMATQKPDGGWADQSIGESYTTALALTILQLDNNYLPAFSR